MEVRVLSPAQKPFRISILGPFQGVLGALDKRTLICNYGPRPPHPGARNLTWKGKQMNRRISSIILAAVGIALLAWLLLTVSIWWIISDLVLLAVLTALVVILAIRLGNQDAFFTTITQDTTRFISVGQSMKRILPNVT